MDVERAGGYAAAGYAAAAVLSILSEIAAELAGTPTRALPPRLAVELLKLVTAVALVLVTRAVAARAERARRLGRLSLVAAALAALALAASALLGAVTLLSEPGSGGVVASALGVAGTAAFGLVGVWYLLAANVFHQEDGFSTVTTRLAAVAGLLSLVGAVVVTARLLAILVGIGVFLRLARLFLGSPSRRG